MAVDSFEEFFEREHERLNRALIVVTRDPHEAEEVMQEAFVRVWEKWGRISRMENPVGYLYRLALNHFFQRQRYYRRIVRRLVSRPSDFALRPSEDELLASVEDRTDIARRLLLLPTRQRAALVVTELLGYDSNAAAEILGVRPGTVRMLVSQAKARLREQGGQTNE